MAEHLHSCLKLNKSNIPESERAGTLYHQGDRKALQVKPPENGSEWVPHP